MHGTKHINRVLWSPTAYTKPVTDFPDWQSFPNAIGGNLFSTPTATLPPGTYDTPVVPVTSFSSLSAVIVPTAGAGQLVVAHWVDALGTIAAEADIFRYRPAAPLVVRTPLRASYVSLALVVTSPGDLTASFWATLLASSSDRVTYPVTGQQAGIDTRSLGAGAVDQWRMPGINSGQAMLAWAPADTSAKLTVEVFCTDENDNGLYHVMYPVATTAHLMQPLCLPGEITVVQVTNTDGVAAHSYGVSLICPPQ